MKAIEDENRRLKPMFSDRNRQADLLKEALGEEWQDPPNAARWPRLRWRRLYNPVETRMCIKL